MLISVIGRVDSNAKNYKWAISTIFLISIALISENNQRLNRTLNFHPKYLERHFVQSDPHTAVARAKYISTYRPHIYAFYSNLGGEDLDYHLAAVWREAWYDAGFEPVVKSIDDAKKHELYQEFHFAFDSSKFLLNCERKKDYLRWLAMIVNGGGWLSDLNTFPLNIHPSEGRVLPNGGNFTVYSDQFSHLMSGSAKEWSRVSAMLLQKFKASNQDKAAVSDKNMMLAIHQSDRRGFDLVPKVAELDKVYSKEIALATERSISFLNLDYDKCTFLQDKNAIHFASPATLRLSFNRLYSREWLKNWKKECVIS